MIDKDFLDKIFTENEIGAVEMEYFPRGIIEIEEIKE